MQAERAKPERLAAAHRRDQASLSRTLANASASAEAAGARADQLATALDRRVDTREQRSPWPHYARAVILNVWAGR